METIIYSKNKKYQGPVICEITKNWCKSQGHWIATLWIVYAIFIRIQSAPLPADKSTGEVEKTNRCQESIH